nr:hypothetical protein [Streptomyces sp. FT05W]
MPGALNRRIQVADLSIADVAVDDDFVTPGHPVLHDRPGSQGASTPTSPPTTTRSSTQSRP